MHLRTLPNPAFSHSALRSPIGGLPVPPTLTARRRATYQAVIASPRRKPFRNRRGRESARGDRIAATRRIRIGGPCAIPSLSLRVLPSRAARGPSYHAPQGWFGQTVTFTRSRRRGGSRGLAATGNG